MELKHQNNKVFHYLFCLFVVVTIYLSSTGFFIYTHILIGVCCSCSKAKTYRSASSIIVTVFNRKNCLVYFFNSNLMCMALSMYVCVCVCVWVCLCAFSQLLCICMQCCALILFLVTDSRRGHDVKCQTLYFSCCLRKTEKCKKKNKKLMLSFSAFSFDSSLFCLQFYYFFLFDVVFVICYTCLSLVGLFDLLDVCI